MTHILRTSFHQNPNVGLYGFANDKFCLLGTNVPHAIAAEIKEVLQVPTHTISIASTSLTGALIAGNNKCILVPNIIFDSELKHLDKLGINYKLLETEFTALGNNIVANDHAALISPDLEPLKNEIKEALQIEHIGIMEIDDLKVIGALVVLNDKGCYLSAHATEEDAQHIHKLFNIPVTRGTVNLGSPYVSAGIIVNKHGLVIGERTGGPEAVAIDEALGFLKK